MGLLGVLLIVSYVATQTIELLTTHAPRTFSGIDFVALVAHDFLLTYTLPFTLAFISVTCLYRYLPHDPSHLARGHYRRQCLQSALGRGQARLQRTQSRPLYSPPPSYSN